MQPLGTTVFDLPDSLAAKADPALVARDEAHFEAIARTLERSIDDLTRRLDAERRAPAGSGQRALDRDQEVHRLTARLRTLRRYGLDLCLGRMVPEGDPAEGPLYVGRLGLAVEDRHHHQQEEDQKLQRTHDVHRLHELTAFPPPLGCEPEPPNVRAW